MLHVGFPQLAARQYVGTCVAMCGLSTRMYNVRRTRASAAEMCLVHSFRIMTYKYINDEFAPKRVHKYCIPSLSVWICTEYLRLTVRLFADIHNGYMWNSTDPSKFSVSHTVNIRSRIKTNKTISNQDHILPILLYSHC